MEDEEYQPAVEYHSESSGDEEINAESARKTRVTRNWTYRATFESVDQAKEWLTQDNCWSLFKSYETVSGRKEDYRCNKVPYRNKQQCASAVQLLYHSENLGVTAFVTAAEHDHDELLANVRANGLNKETKTFIDHLLSLKVTATKTIVELLAKETEKNPALKMPKDARQLYNYLANLRNKEGRPNLNYDELSQWCLEQQDVPDDANKAFVASYQINIDNDDPENFPDIIKNVNNPVKSMRLFITTRHLMVLASEHCRLLQADATYKLTWLGFPVFIIGFSDMNKVS